MMWIHQIHQEIDFPILNTLFYAAYVTAKQTHEAGRKQIADKAVYGKKVSGQTTEKQSKKKKNKRMIQI